MTGILQRTEEENQISLEIVIEVLFNENLTLEQLQTEVPRRLCKEHWKCRADSERRAGGQWRSQQATKRTKTLRRTEVSPLHQVKRS